MSVHGWNRLFFFRHNIGLHVDVPHLQYFRQNLVDGKHLEVLEPFVDIVRNGLVCMLCHDVGDIFKHLEVGDLEIAALFALGVKDFSSADKSRKISRPNRTRYNLGIAALERNVTSLPDTVIVRSVILLLSLIRIILRRLLSQWWGRRRRYTIPHRPRWMWYHRSWT